MKLLLNTHAPEIEILGEAESVKSGLEAIEQHNPELILLDVEMEDGTGFDLLSQCPKPKFKVIFITAHDDYALRAIKFSALDYLLKPVDSTELKNALEKAKQQVSEERNALSISTLVHNQNEKQENQKLVLSDSEKIYLVSKHEIIRCQSEGNYTKFFLTNNRELLISKTMKEYIKLLEGKQFFRTHQSHLINLEHFSHYEKADGGTVYMKDGSFLPVAVRRKDLLMEALKLQ